MTDVVEPSGFARVEPAQGGGSAHPSHWLSGPINRFCMFARWLWSKPFRDPILVGCSPYGLLTHEVIGRFGIFDMEPLKGNTQAEWNLTSLRRLLPPFSPSPPAPFLGGSLGFGTYLSCQRETIGTKSFHVGGSKL